MPSDQWAQFAPKYTAVKKFKKCSRGITSKRKRGGSKGFGKKNNCIFLTPST